MKIKFYAVRKAEIRKAGTVQLECLVIQLDGKSWAEAGRNEKLAFPNQQVIAHVGISKKGQWILSCDDKLYVRYPRYELTGNKPIYARNAQARVQALKTSPKSYRYGGRVAGLIHLWGGDTAWGGSGKMALKPFNGKFRTAW